jgi:hypothetical protein
MGKATMVVGLAVGYVLGTRDGRQRYQQIKTQANRVAQDPRFKEKVGRVQDLAMEKIPLFPDRAGRASHRADDKAGNAPPRSVRPTPSATEGAVTTPVPGQEHAPGPVLGDSHV